MKALTMSTLVRVLVSLFVIAILISVASKDSYADLIGTWSFEGSGDVIVDSSGNGHDGEMLDGAQRTDDGKFGKGVWFDGQNAIVAIPDADDLDLETFTLLAWFKFEDPTGGWQTLIGKQTKGDENFIIEAAASGGLNTTFNRIGLCTGGTVVVDEEWHHVASVHDKESLRLYIDGSLDQELAGAATPATNAGPLRLGGLPARGEMFSGVMDEVAVFNAALTEEEIREFMEGMGAAESVESVGKLAAAWGSIKAQY